MLDEPGLDQLDQSAVAERVPDTRGHVVHRRTGVGTGIPVEGLAGHGDDGRHHQVDRDHVGHTFGDPGELTEQSSGVGHDDRFGHPEAADPARPRFGQGRLDDRGTDNGHGHGVAELADEGPLPEGLGVRVGVGPSEGLGPGLADLDHVLLDPLLPKTLGSLGQEMQTGTTDLAARRLRKPGQALRGSGLGVGVPALAAGRGDLAPPVNVHAEGVAFQQLLTGLTLVGAGHVGSGHRDEMDRAGPALIGGPTPSGHDRGRYPRRSQQIHLDGGVEWGVEADRGGGVDHHVALGQQLQAGLVDSQAVGGDVARHRRHSGRHLGVEVGAELAPQEVEAVVLQDLLGGPLHRRRTATRSDQEDHPAVRDAPEDPLHQRRAQESGRTGDEELLAGEGLADTGHQICLPYGK
jgi:hypothetical protein